MSARTVASSGSPAGTSTAPFTAPNSDVSCTPGTCAMISCTVCAGERPISSAVMTVVDAPARMFGAAVVAAGADPPDGCARGAGCGAGARVTRPRRDAQSGEDSTRLRSTGFGGLTCLDVICLG